LARLAAGVAFARFPLPLALRPSSLPALCARPLGPSAGGVGLGLSLLSLLGFYAQNREIF